MIGPVFFLAFVGAVVDYSATSTTEEGLFYLKIFVDMKINRTDFMSEAGGTG